MKSLGIFLLVCVFSVSPQTVYSQGFLDKLKDKVEEKINEKENEAAEKAVNKTSDDIEKGVTEGEKKEKKGESSTEESVKKSPENAVAKQEDEKAAPKSEALKSYSKYDFIPGEKVLFYEDFSQDNIAEFPARWNTNLSGEVVTINKYPGKWFKMKPGGTFYPEWEKLTLPDNYTIEFDYIYNFRGEANPPLFCFSLYKTLPNEGMDGIVPGKAGIQFTLGAYGFTVGGWEDGGWAPDNGSVDNNMLEGNYDKIIRVSIWVQKQRARLYINQEKIFDLPRLVHKGITYDRFRFALWGIEPENFDPMISNFRIAVGAPDTRSKLLTEGKLVTRGIKFDTGSDKIKPESYGVLKDIAGVLKENSGVKVKIIGHTDTDGSADKNLDLSKRRAASVKTALSGEFGIDASRMETDGKGQTEPCDVNTTTEGKANNRRVEFIKTN